MQFNTFKLPINLPEAGIVPKANILEWIQP